MKSLSAVAVVAVSLMLSDCFGRPAWPLVIGLLLFLAGSMISHLKQYPGRAGYLLAYNWPALLMFGPGLWAVECGLIWFNSSKSVLGAGGIIGIITILEVRSDDRHESERYHQFFSRRAYLDVLISAALADGDLTNPELDRLFAVARDLFTRPEFVRKRDEHVSALIYVQAGGPTDAAEAARVMAGLTPELRAALRFQVASLLHDRDGLGPECRAWLDRCLGHDGGGPWPVLRFFDHGLTAGEEARREWLAELGLPEPAGAEEVRAAYHARAREYHPDKLAGVPPQVRALAGAKMAAINAAYRGLCDQAAAGEAALCYLEPARPVPSWPGPGVEVPCRCWLCGGSILVPAHARREGCRCGTCHALLGLRFDPTAT